VFQNYPLILAVKSFCHFGASLARQARLHLYLAQIVLAKIPFQMMNEKVEILVTSRNFGQKSKFWLKKKF